MNWISTLKERQRELESIAQWASGVSMGEVRDHCRKAIAAIQYEIERFQAMEKKRA